MATRKKRRRRRKTRHRTGCRGTKLPRTQFRRRKENYRRVSASKRRQRRMLRGRAEERPEGPGQHLATPTRCPSCCTPRGRRGGCTAHICRHYIKRASVMRAQTPRLCACLSARSWIASSAARCAAGPTSVETDEPSWSPAPCTSATTRSDGTCGIPRGTAAWWRRTRGSTRKSPVEHKRYHYIMSFYADLGGCSGANERGRS